MVDSTQTRRAQVTQSANEFLVKAEPFIRAVENLEVADPSMRLDDWRERVDTVELLGHHIWSTAYRINQHVRSLRRIQEVARMLRMSGGSLRDVVSSGAIPAVRLKGVRYISESDVNSWLRANYNGHALPEGDDLLSRRRLTSQEAAKALSCPVEAVDALVHTGVLPAIKLSSRSMRCYVVLESDCDWKAICRRAHLQWRDNRDQAEQTQSVM